jgi:hypothetical protein
LSNFVVKGLYTNPNALKEVQRVSERRNSRRDNSRATNKTSITSVSGGGTLPPIEELENTEFDVSQVTESVSPKSRKKPNESQNTSRRTNPKKNVLSGRVAKRQRVSDVNKQITTSLNSLSNTVMEEMNDVINICNNGQVRRMSESCVTRWNSFVMYILRCRVVLPQREIRKNEKSTRH